MSQETSGTPGGAPEYVTNAPDINALHSQVDTGRDETTGGDVTEVQETQTSAKEEQSTGRTPDNVKFDEHGNPYIPSDGVDSEEEQVGDEEEELTPEEEEALLAEAEEEFDEEFDEEDEEDEIDFVEDILSAYFEDGVILFDGEEEGIPFNERSAEDQSTALQYTLTQATETINELRESLESAQEDATQGLSETELDFINTVRETGQTPEEFISAELGRIVQEYNLDNINSRNLEDYTTDEIFKLDYFENLTDEEKQAAQENPEELDAQVEEELEIAKTSRNYESNMEKKRRFYMDRDKMLQEQAQRAEAERVEKEREELRKDFVNATYAIDEIGAYTIDDDIKDFLYGKLLDQDENGMTPFQIEMMSDPEMALKTAYHAYFGEQNEANLIETLLHDAQMAKAQGKREVVEGFPRQPIPKGTVVQKSNNKKGNFATTTISTKVDKESLQHKQDASTLQRLLQNRKS